MVLAPSTCDLLKSKQLSQSKIVIIIVHFTSLLFSLKFNFDVPSVS